MEIVRYRNAGDLDVRFEDGTIVSRRAYRDFTCGGILHPGIKQGVFLGYSIKKAFEEDDSVWYMCRDENGQKDIMTPQNMLKERNK